jgi:Uri superfamily endonuclease
MAWASSPGYCSDVVASLREVAGSDGCDAASLAGLPARPGAYLLLIRLAAALPLRIGTLPAAVLPAGWYVYAGSARGPGGIRARAGRHLRQGKRPHWHIDRLTEVAATCWAFAVLGGRECDLVRALLARPAFELALAGFGSSDCRHCAGHLLAAPRRAAWYPKPWPHRHSRNCGRFVSPAG